MILICNHTFRAIWPSDGVVWSSSPLTEAGLWVTLRVESAWEWKVWMGGSLPFHLRWWLAGSSSQFNTTIWPSQCHCLFLLTQRKPLGCLIIEIVGMIIESSSVRVVEWPECYATPLKFHPISTAALQSASPAETAQESKCKTNLVILYNSVSRIFVRAHVQPFCFFFAKGAHKKLHFGYQNKKPKTNFIDPTCCNL